MTNRQLVPAENALSNKSAVALIGIDPEAHFTRAVTLFTRLGFKGARATLLNVAEPANIVTLPNISFADGLGLDAISAEQINLQRAEQGKRALEVAASMMVAEGIEPNQEFRTGYAAFQLLNMADQLQANLIVTASSHHGALSHFFLNSVSRGVVIGAKQSVLIAKHDLAEGKPLTAVLAVDHSNYCNWAVDQLIRFQPMGIRKIIVLTALNPGVFSDHSPFPYLEDPTSQEENNRERKLYDKSREICDRLWTIRVQAEPLVVDGSPPLAIDYAMEHFNADLLIMAAQGHSFFERAFIGSLSLYEAVAKEHSLLVLRA